MRHWCVPFKSLSLKIRKEESKQDLELQNTLIDSYNIKRLKSIPHLHHFLFVIILFTSAKDGCIPTVLSKSFFVAFIFIPTANPYVTSAA